MDSRLKLALFLLAFLRQTNGQGFGPFPPPFAFPGFGRPPPPFGPPPPGLSTFLPPSPPLASDPLSTGIPTVPGPGGFPGISTFPDLSATPLAGATIPSQFPSAPVSTFPEITSGDTGLTLPTSTDFGGTIGIPTGATPGVLDGGTLGAIGTDAFPSFPSADVATRPFPEISTSTGTLESISGLTSATGTSSTITGLTASTSTDAGVPDGVNPATAAEPSFASRFGTGVGGRRTSTGNSQTVTSAGNSISVDALLSQFVPQTDRRSSPPQRPARPNAFDTARVLNTVFGSRSSVSQQENPFVRQDLSRILGGDRSAPSRSSPDRPTLTPRTTLPQGRTTTNSITSQGNSGQQTAMPNTNQLGISTSQTTEARVPETNFGTGFPAGSRFSGGMQSPPQFTGSSSSVSRSGTGRIQQVSTESFPSIGGQIPNSQFSSALPSVGQFPSSSSNTQGVQFPPGSSNTQLTQFPASSNTQNMQFPSIPSMGSRFSPISSESRFAAGTSVSQAGMSMTSTNSATVLQGQSGQANVQNGPRPSQPEFVFTRQSVDPNIVVQSNSQTNTQMIRENSESDRQTVGGNSQTNPQIVGSATNGFAQFIGNAQRGTVNSNEMQFPTFPSQVSGFPATSGNSVGNVAQQGTFQSFPSSGFGQMNADVSGGTVMTGQTSGFTFPAQSFASGFNNQSEVTVIETGGQKIVFSNQQSVDNKTRQIQIDVPIVQNISLCQTSGCPTGSQCIFNDLYICPDWILSLQCKCMPGCTINNRFIPRGQTVTINNCGDQCSCVSEDGKPSCAVSKCPSNAM